VSGKGGPRRPQRAETISPAEKLTPPSREAWAALGPYARTRHTVHGMGTSLALDVPGDVFSTQRIDEGTQLLLSHLPAPGDDGPKSLLDLGCGYGALGLPIAAKFPSCRSLLIDRDLLAVAASGHNARMLKLSNVEARPSLGFRDLPEVTERFDWLLCNVPARIGLAAIGYFLESGRALLTTSGELRVVVIRDLVPVVREACAARGITDLIEVVHGPRHSVFALAAKPGHPLSTTVDDDAIYARDQSQLPIPHGPHAPGISISRPHDASEDPRHADALALLFSALPRVGPKRAFTFRCGFGGAALASLLLWPETQVVAQERDLLDAAFLVRNAKAQLVNDRLQARASLFPLQAAQGDLFKLIVGEISPSAGEGVLIRELKETRAMLAERGQALVLVPKKLSDAVIQANQGFSLLLERGPFSVWRA
jgi:16S rRNA (guanine1207-N2)-methyltransferase